MPSVARILVVGLDSADGGLVSRLCDSGELPALRSLRERGTRGVLKSPLALADDATWASFATASGPGKHGRYFWRRLRPGTYAMPPFGDAPFGREPFWSALSRAGRRVAVIDVPKSPVAIELNGLQLANWLVHGRDGATRSVPPGLAADVLARYGDDSTDRPGTEAWLCRMEPLSANELEPFLERLLTSIERKAALSAEQLSHGGWDLFLTVFKESHCAAHQCWHLLDARHPAHDRELGLRLGGPVQRVYRALDAALGRLIGLVGTDATVIVFSDLGMGVNDTGEHLLDGVLRRLEWADASPLRRARAWLRRRVSPASLRHRRAYQVEHNEISGAIRVNVKGREPHGSVERGELDAFYESLTRDLLDLVDPGTGHPIVERVVRVDEEFPGEQRDGLPDLLVVWRRNAPITGAASPKIGELRVGPPPFRPGNHVADGWFVCAGPTVAPGREIEPASIMDLGPTIAALLAAGPLEADGTAIAAVSPGAQRNSSP